MKTRHAVLVLVFSIAVVVLVIWGALAARRRHQQENLSWKGIKDAVTGGATKVKKALTPNVPKGTFHDTSRIFVMDRTGNIRKDGVDTSPANLLTKLNPKDLPTEDVIY